MFLLDGGLFSALLDYRVWLYGVVADDAARWMEVGDGVCYGQRMVVSDALLWRPCLGVSRCFREIQDIAMYTDERMVSGR